MVSPTDLLEDVLTEHQSSGLLEYQEMTPAQQMYTGYENSQEALSWIPGSRNQDGLRSAPEHQRNGGIPRGQVDSRLSRLRHTSGI